MGDDLAREAMPAEEGADRHDRQRLRTRGPSRNRARLNVTSPANLLPVEARLNRQKGARGPVRWLPPDEGFRCQYVLRFERVMRAHGLRAPEDEARAMAVLRAEACG